MWQGVVCSKSVSFPNGCSESLHKDIVGGRRRTGSCATMFVDGLATITGIGNFH